MKKVVVVTPLYKAGLTEDEACSLNQMHRVLAGHERIVVGPRSVLKLAPSWLSGFSRSEAFEDEDFTSIASYNRLMLSDRFYARFANYEFILICQSDALPLQDSLLEWCAAGYDYLGAPFLKHLAPRLLWRWHVWRWQRRAARARAENLLDDNGWPHPNQNLFLVGNGGFSLRRVAAMRAVLCERVDQLDAYFREQRSSGHYAANEDMFFSRAGSAYGGPLRTPDASIGALFALESCVTTGLKLTGGVEPFGCHGWPHYYHDWAAIFRSRGVAVPHRIDSALAKESLGLGQ